MRDYDQWKKEVDVEIVLRTGLSSDDLDDWRYRDDFKERRTPKATAIRAIRNAKQSCGG